MGYALYSTPRGDAGYAVEDVCRAEGCDEKIDRGLSYLCGSDPRDEFPEVGCGWWFCGKHLFYPGDPELHMLGEGLCSPCLAAYESESVHEDEAPEGQAAAEVGGSDG